MSLPNFKDIILDLIIGDKTVTTLTQYEKQVLELTYGKDYLHKLHDKLQCALRLIQVELSNLETWG